MYKLYTIKIKKAKYLQHALQDITGRDILIHMNTLTTIINSINQNINEEIIDDLTKSVGIDHNSAVKMVTEFEDFNLWLSAQENPVLDF